VRRRLVATAVSAALLLVTANVSASAAASSPSASPSASPTPAPLPAGFPAQVLGLNVEKEDVSKTLASDTRSLYVNQVVLYSFREPSKLLQATLEVARFKSDAPSTSADFQTTIVNAMGGSAPIVLRIGATPIYVTTSKGLTIAVWFRNGHMLALSIRNTYAEPKQLLRVALGINP
jgi:hypothetical protein